MSFEEWLKKNRTKIPKYMRDTEEGRKVLESSYNAGVAAERERCAAICEADIQEHAITITAAQQETHNQCCQYLAAAIRRGE